MVSPSMIIKEIGSNNILHLFASSSFQRRHFGPLGKSCRKPAGIRRSKKRSAKSSNGFSLTETLLSMLAVSVCAVMFIMILQCAKTMMKDNRRMQLQLGILQLRTAAFEAAEVHADEGILYFESAEETQFVEFHRNRIVQRPGYLIYIDGIDDGYFIQEEREIYLELEKNGKKERWQIR